MNALLGVPLKKGANANFAADNPRAVRSSRTGQSS